MEANYFPLLAAAVLNYIKQICLFTNFTKRIRWCLSEVSKNKDVAKMLKFCSTKAPRKAVH